MERGGPQFFKVFIPALCSNHLRIPPGFIAHIGSESLGVVSLKGPGGSIWTVELVEKTDGLHFESGWKEFVGDNLIEIGDFLIFRLDGPSSFSVMVFDTTACEKQECFLAKPCKKEYETVRAIGNDEDMGNKVREMPNSSRALLCSLDDDIIVGKKRKVKRIRLLMDMSCYNSSESNLTKTNNKGKYISEAPTEGQEETMFGNSAEIEEFMMGNDLYNTPIFPRNQSIKSKLNLCYGSSPSKKLAGFGNKSAQCLRLIKSSEIHRFGQFVARVHKMPCLTSQRRPVTVEERDYALQRANSFVSDKPFVIVVMRESYVYNGFLMHIPTAFARDHLPKENQKFMLWDPSGKQWPVNYVTYENRQSALSAGWAGFAFAHNLEKDDVCILELVDQKNIKVHFFRVLEEITPLLRTSKLRAI